MVISQREARRLRRRVVALEAIISSQRRIHGQEWQGVNIVTVEWEPRHHVPQSIRTATRLGHKVVAVANQEGEVKFMALPHEKERP